ncbi:MAG: anti-sigma factor family protein, partial [Planctomycetota bacterium]
MKRHLTEEELIQHKFRLAPDEQAAGAAEHLAGCAECRERLELLDQKFAALDLLAEDVVVSDELIAQTVAHAKRPVRRRIVPFGKYHWLGTAAAVLVLGLVFLAGDFGEHEARRPEIADKSSPEGLGRYSGSAVPSEPAEQEQVTVVAKKLGDEMGAQVEEALSERMLAMKPVASPSPTSVGSLSDKLSTDPTTRPDADASPEHYALGPARGRGPALKRLDESAKPGSERQRPPLVMQRTTVAGATTPKAEKLLAGTAGGDLTLAKISEKPPFAPASAIELVTLPRRDNVQLTIYNSADLTLVREKRNLTLKQGWNWLQLMWANTLIDPTSLSLEPAAQGDKVDVQQLVFPARLRELGRWLIRSEISGQVPFEVTYFTSGLPWRAFYMGTLSQDEKKMRLQGYVRVANGSGEDYENAQT